MDAHERDALVAALGEVMEADAAREFFNDPVDAVALRLHDYHDIVTRPMSLSQVRDRLGAGTGGEAGQARPARARPRLPPSPLRTRASRRRWMTYASCGVTAARTTLRLR
jgi:hypothetical protein